ncbi:hypothetical protein [Chondromyces apiculatus]|uniref:Uncharacterized protein n=1 Tax=Chondromyces apiculatus DSM 436 TaxID=1192034 RepID=A0A017T9K0_9BACT|nr:hypothetical protein [Chondromyces apiculatus]EYF05919.1 Hypothetical protein CAP_2378 [Chondromyces apiculatus DSM 436]
MPLDSKVPRTLTPPAGIPISSRGYGASGELSPESEIAPSQGQEICFDAQTWQPDQYASIYYPVDQIGAENRALLECEVEIWSMIQKFDAESGKTRGNGSSPATPYTPTPRSGVHPRVDMVILGGGGTLWDLPPAVPHVNGICYTDPHENSRSLVQQYLDAHEDRRWDEYIARTLQFEGNEEITADAIRERDALMRERILSLTSCNIRRRPPVIVGASGVHVVSVHFVMESITNNRSVWRRLMRNSTSIVGDQGYLILAALGKAQGWRSAMNGEQQQPATYVTQEDIHSVLDQLGFDVFFMRWIPAEEANAMEYEGIISCAARRRAQA